MQVYTWLDRLVDITFHLLQFCLQTPFLLDLYDSSSFAPSDYKFLELCSSKTVFYSIIPNTILNQVNYLGGFYVSVWPAVYTE